MIRPFTAICMVAAGASGLFLYQSKHRAVMLDRQIMSVLKQTEATRERIGVMRAEWALLNEPERLAELSSKHLGLRTLAPTQFASVADLGSRLPAPVAPGLLVMPVDDVVALTPQPAMPSAAAQAPAAAAYAAPPAAPLNASVAASVAPSGTAARNTTHAAQAAPAATPAVAAAAQAAPAPARPRVARAEPRDEAPPVRAVQAAAPTRTLAPVIAVAASQIRNSASVPGIGEAVAARMTATRPLPQPGWAAPAPAHGYAAQPIGVAGGYAPALPATQQVGAMQQAGGQPMAVQSALGGARPALPPPVPYGAQPR